jgi:hypothetical protein
MSISNITLTKEYSASVLSSIQTVIIDVGVVGIVIYFVQYLLAAYCCLSAGHQLIVQHLLPLQIYAEDARTIIQSLEQEDPTISEKAGQSKTTTEFKKFRLRKLIDQYDEIVLHSEYCHVKIDSKTGKDCCCCFTLEDGGLCYILSRLFTCKCCCKSDPIHSHYERFKYKSFDKDHITLKTTRWRSANCLCFKRCFYCFIQHKCTKCCKPTTVEHNVTVNKKDVFFGTYEPLAPSRHGTMNAISVDTGSLEGSVRDVFDTNRRDAWHNFCGWWKTWLIENLKNAFKAELDSQNIAKEFKIKF